MKKILFICDPLDSFKLLTDTTYLLLETATQLNFEIYYTLVQDIFTVSNEAFANSWHINLLTSYDNNLQTNFPWYKKINQLITPLTDFNAVFVRNDPPFNMEYYYLTQILTLAEKQGVQVINNSYALRNFNEKLTILNFPNLIAPTLVSKDKQIILNFLNEHKECVIKPLDQMAGRGVFKLSLADANHLVIIETATNFFAKTVMVQKFIPEVTLGDKRIFIVNGKVIPHSLHRIPQNNQIRGNLAAGGRAEVRPIEERDQIIALQITKWLVEQNIKFAGIDLIGNKLTEVNITSPTGTRQILNHTGVNIPKMLLDNL